ncbi:MAG: STAS domain-containing protein [Eubacterium sp.]|nr:STAS domain-containing protein [Eubacterium sp.]
MQIDVLKNDEEALTLAISGEVTSSNAAEFRSEVIRLREQNQTAELVLDFGELIYISSAGLRVIMHFLKKEKSRFHIVNVSDEIYDILKVTGFTGKVDISQM